MGKISFKNINIYEYPREEHIELAKKLLPRSGEKLLHVDGDSHANPFRLLWNWVVAEAIQISKESYDRLFLLYKDICLCRDSRRYNSPIPMSKIECDAILNFIRIIHTQIKVNSKCQRILLQLGDTENDRNGPDTLIKALFYHMRANGAAVNECWSNHNHDALLLDHEKETFGYEIESRNTVHEREEDSYISYREHGKFLDAMEDFYPTSGAEDIFTKITQVNNTRYQLIYYTEDEQGCLHLAHHAPVPPMLLKTILSIWHRDEGDKAAPRPGNAKALIDWANEQFRKKLLMQEPGSLGESEFKGCALQQINRETRRNLIVVDEGQRVIHPHPISLLTWYRPDDYKGFAYLENYYREVEARFPGEVSLLAHGHDGVAEELGPNLNSVIGIREGEENCLFTVQKNLKPGCHNLSDRLTSIEGENLLHVLLENVDKDQVKVDTLDRENTAVTLNGVIFSNTDSKKRPASSEPQDLPLPPSKLKK